MAKVVQNFRGMYRLGARPISFFRKKVDCAPEFPYVITRAAHKDFEEIENMMWNSYCADEPLMKALGLGFCRDEDFSQDIRNALRQGLSKVAKCRYDGKIVGACINASSAPSDIQKMESYACCVRNCSLRDLYLFKAYLQDAPKLYERYCCGHIFGIEHVFVNRQNRNQGVAKCLIKESLRLGEDAGFSLLRCNATSSFVQKICDDLGMQLVSQIPYCSYLGANNRPILTPGPPHEKCVSIYINTPHRPWLTKP